MIKSGRQAHFYTIVVLSCTLPLVFLAALIWRPSIPTVGREGEAIAGTADGSIDAIDSLFADAGFAPGEGGERSIATETLSVRGVPILAETTQAEGSGATLFLNLQPTQPLQFSDVLVYWSGGEPVADTLPDTVPATAILLGPLSGTSRRRFSLPQAVQAAADQPGQLFFYSQGQNKMLGATALSPSLFP